jgi:hypothetical protein
MVGLDRSVRRAGGPGQGPSRDNRGSPRGSRRSQHSGGFACKRPWRMRRGVASAAPLRTVTSDTRAAGSSESVSRVPTSCGLHGSARTMERHVHIRGCLEAHARFCGSRAGGVDLWRVTVGGGAPAAIDEVGPHSSSEAAEASLRSDRSQGNLREVAHPTDRVQAEGSQVADGEGGWLPVATPGSFARSRRSRSGSLDSRIQRLVLLCRVSVDFHHSPADPFWPVRVRRVGCRVHSGACIRGCSSCSAGREVSGLCARMRRRREGSAQAGGNIGEGLREGSSFLYEICVGPGTWRRSNSVREVKGHERAAAVVHPIKASLRTQDREDRKRSWREYLTNTGARFAGRAL